MGGNFVGEVGGEEDDGFLGGVGADFFKSLESADVDAAWGLGEEMSGFSDGGSGGFFTFSGDNSGTAFTLGFGLFRHGAFHVGGKFDILKTDTFNVDTPFVGLCINDFADLGGDFVAFAQDFIEVEVAGDVAEGSLGEGAGCVTVVRGFEDSFLGIDDASVDDGVDINGDVVAGDNFLFWNVHRGSADVDFEHFVDIGDNNTETRG